MRPIIRAALRYDGRQTQAFPVQIDTGSDLCMFDHELPLLLGLNAYQVGASSSATGIGGTEEIALFPIDVVFPDLDDASWTITAQFKRLPNNLNGILGHAGFLGRMRATFAFGREFELSEIKRD